MIDRRGQYGRYNARCEDGYCAEKASPGQSKIEADIFGALNYVIGGGKRASRINTFGREVEVDMTLDPGDGWILAVEYDGAYWHQGREHHDLQKAELIEADSHEYRFVMRIREDPLRPLRPVDICVSKRSDGGTCARLALLHILHMLPPLRRNQENSGRIESLLAAAAAPLSRDQVRCRRCWSIARMLRRTDAPVGSGFVVIASEHGLPMKRRASGPKAA